MDTLNVEVAGASDFRIFREVLSICQQHGLSADARLDMARGGREIFRHCQEGGLSAAESYQIVLQIVRDDLQMEIGPPTPERDRWGDLLPSLGEPAAAELLPDMGGLQAQLKRGESAAKRRQKFNCRPVTAFPGCPMLSAYLAAHDGYYPDAVVDTQRKRQRDSRKVAALLAELKVRYLEGIKLYRISLPELDPLNLYDHELVRRAKKTVRRWLNARGLRGWFKVERGRNGGTHVHIVTSSSAGSGGTGVYDISGLADYLVKPADARACLKRDENIPGAELKRQKGLAAEYWLTARASLALGRNLPRFHESCTPRGVQ